MNQIQKTVGEFAVEFPGATRIFERLGIDYCCGGQRTLEDACTEAGISVKELTASVDLNQPSNETARLSTAPLKEVIAHIMKRHHAFTKTEIQRLRFMINKVFEVHFDKHPELLRVRSIFQALSSELEPHMLKEECVLFPYVVRMQEAIEHHHFIATPPFRTVANPIEMMKLEHEGAGYLLNQLRQVTSNYTPPADACQSFQTLYNALEAFEQDLHQHIHLENNILFPRARKMEKGLLA